MMITVLVPHLFLSSLVCDTGYRLVGTNQGTLVCVGRADVKQEATISLDLSSTYYLNKMQNIDYWSVLLGKKDAR